MLLRNQWATQFITQYLLHIDVHTYYNIAKYAKNESVKKYIL